MMKMLSRLPGENNNNYSYRAIKEGILSLELLPGQLLSVGELTEVLKVSSTPIKSALWKLHQEHLVDVIPQVGSYVSRINLELVEEASFMWFDLEKKYLKSACNYFSEENVDQLRRNLDLQEMLLIQQNILSPKKMTRQFNELDDSFHSIIFRGHHRDNTWKAISRMNMDYHRMINFSQHHFEQMIAEHRNILSIIENKEMERVEDTLKKHIFKPLDYWRRYKEEICEKNERKIFMATT
ncbi:GntR family transcriptional regulator [Bacillus sp. E214]|uniref:GntR family transcriptional regulator n=1 Tax=Bacillus sp. E214 TaxID=2587156 RepID=UPI0011DF3D18|nr:GntR family transcriptional regulator [Bacillus sp. E214]